VLTFQDLYESYVEDVYHFSLWLAGDRFEAEDITSETFVRAWVRRSKIRTKTLKAYLFTIARNLYLEKNRKYKRQVKYDDIYTDTNPTPDIIVSRRLEIEEVRKYLFTVSEVDRAAFIMQVHHELPYAEIARVLGISTVAARVKVHRIRKKLLTAAIQREVNNL